MKLVLKPQGATIVDPSKKLLCSDGENDVVELSSCKTSPPLDLEELKELIDCKKEIKTKDDEDDRPDKGGRRRLLGSDKEITENDGPAVKVWDETKKERSPVDLFIILACGGGVGVRDQLPLIGPLLCGSLTPIVAEGVGWDPLPIGPLH